MSRNIPLCKHRDKHKNPVATSYSIETDHETEQTFPVTTVLWRCEICGKIKTQTIRGTFTLAEINGEMPTTAQIIEAADAAQRMITDQIGDDALALVSEPPAASPTVAEERNRQAAEFWKHHPLVPLQERIIALGRHAYPVPGHEDDLTPEQQRAYDEAIDETYGVPPQPVSETLGKLTPVPSYYELGEKFDQKPGLPVRVPGSGPQIPRRGA